MAKEKWVAKEREGWLKRDGRLMGGKGGQKRWVAKGREGWLKRDGCLRGGKGC